MEQTRRDFIKNVSIASAGIALGANSLTAKSYNRIIGANNRMNFAVVGLHGRGQAHITALSQCKDVMLSHICDVDSRYLDQSYLEVPKLFKQEPVKEKDFRKLLESKDIDAISIATPDHWHTPMTIMGLQAGKHIYVEKPCSHNPHEGELVVQAQKKYGKVVQMGNQQRSSGHTIEIIKKIKEGLIGKPYFAKAWYSNNRKSIGVGQVAPIPDYLDWELWQGPAPRKEYKDNYHPYNWHWFRHWGTGETLNNATHEVDVCRWALGVDMPKKVTATGGRYHFNDDWQFYDTLITNFEYDDKMITWEGKSCQNKKYFGRSRGSSIHGTEGTVIVDRNSYEVYDNNDKKIDEYQKETKDGTIDVYSRGPLTTEHFQNFINGIRSGEKLNSPIEDGNISVTMLQLSNIAWEVGRELNLNTKNGHILNDSEAMQNWQREYEKGWEPKI